jgi:aspartyl-tRNA synthetase
VCDFPLFQPSEENIKEYHTLQSTHHPFTAPSVNDTPTLKALGQQEVLDIEAVLQVKAQVL